MRNGYNMAEPKTDFGREIRHFRLLRRMRQADLAKSLGVHQTYVSGMELGEILPIYPLVGLMAEVLGVSQHNLVRLWDAEKRNA